MTISFTEMIKSGTSKIQQALTGDFYGNATKTYTLAPANITILQCTVESESTISSLLNYSSVG